MSVSKDSSASLKGTMSDGDMKENTIAVLETGTGKTLIALLLLKYIRDLDLGTELVSPKVFGMTASPSSSKAEVSAAIKQLEANLFCTAFTASNVGEVRQYSNPAEEEIIFFTEVRCMPTSIISQFSPLIAKGENYDLGPVCADMFLKVLRIQVQETQDRELESQRLSQDPRVKSAERPTSEDFQMDIDEVLEEVQANSDDKEERFKKWLFAQVLINILKGYKEFGDMFCGIIFTELLSIAALVGHGNTGIRLRESNMNIGNQKKVVESFRAGSINLMIATSVAEEGLDIQPCMLVVRFDMAKHMIQNIQSRGRARSMKARYIQMVPKNNEAALQSLREMKSKEAAMKFELSRDKTDMDSLSQDLEHVEEYVVPTTGAKVTSLSAVPLLTITATEYNIGVMTYPKATEFMGFICAEGRYVTGFVQRSKQAARRSAAFEAVKKLVEIGELDERLRPARFLKMPGSNSMRLSLGLNELPRTNLLSLSILLLHHWAFKDGWEKRRGWLVLVQVEDQHKVHRFLDFGLLVPAPLMNELEDTCLISLDDRPSKLKLCMSKQSIDLTDRYEELLKYGKVIWSALLRKGNQKISPSYLVVPLAKDGEHARVSVINGEPLEDVIDWNVVKVSSLSLWTEPNAGFEKTLYDIPKYFMELREELVVGDRWFYNRKYKVMRVEEGKNPFNTAYAGFNSVADFYRLRLGTKEEIKKDQCLLLATPIPHIHQGSVSQDSPSSTIVFLIPQFCTPYPVSSTLLIRSGLYLPLVIRAIHFGILALELRERTGLEAHIAPDMMMDATNALGAKSGRNYERLEFLGDSFLKLHISLHMFCKYPAKNEGWLTTTRKILERNSNLKHRGMKLGFPSSVLSQSISRKTWTVPDLEVPTMQVMSNKLIADTVEAVIGGCYMKSGAQGGGFAVSKLLAMEDFHSDWIKYAEMFKDNVGALGRSVEEYLDEDGRAYKSRMHMCQRIEDMFGYKFKDSFLLAEALTHSSAIQDGSLSCYQRLEFLGDSVLGFAIAAILYREQDTAQPGLLSDLKVELVNNQFLAPSPTLPTPLKHVSTSPNANSQNPTSALHHAAPPSVTKKPSHNSLSNHKPLPAHSQDPPKSTKRTLEQAETPRAEKPLFWLDLPVAPKAVSDMYEAVLGAIFLDSGCCLAEAEKAIRKTLMGPWWPYFLEAGIKTVEGMRAAQMLADGKGMGYDYVRDLTRVATMVGCKEVIVQCVEQPDKRGFWDCTIKKHNVLLSSVSGNSKKRVRREATLAAIPVLEKYKTEVDEHSEEERDEIDEEVGRLVKEIEEGRWREIYPGAVVGGEEGRWGMEDVKMEVDVGVMEEEEKRRLVSKVVDVMAREEYDVAELLMEVAGMEVVTVGEEEGEGVEGLVVEDGLLMPARKRRMVVLNVKEVGIEMGRGVCGVTEEGVWEWGWGWGCFCGEEGKGVQGGGKGVEGGDKGDGENARERVL
ncbi:hypothetical protein BC829DRAFT_417370 [Chytridium lagenaria]|nr:hypothetical protein BC829DRAFT_417370 [Chytridium lagenaria]